MKRIILQLFQNVIDFLLRNSGLKWIIIKKIVGRELVREKLSDILISHRPELIAVYCRKRIGENYLIREFFLEKIIKELKISSGGRFSNSLEDLMESGFILRYEAYKNNTKTTLYRMYDEFCLFHLQFMVPYKRSKWTQIFQKQAYKSWCEYAFETICLKHYKEVKKAMKCDQIVSKNYSWQNAKAQIDLVKQI